VQEVVELAVHHLQDAEDGIISFGQGCEGDPSMQADLIAEAIKEIRRQTNNGTINMNTNVGNTEGIKKIIDAGIDSLRVSLNSGTDAVYNAYYRPVNYTLDNVRQSLRYAADNGVYTYLNLLTFPGINDCSDEVESLLNLVQENDVKAIQVRNLNIDPETMKPIIELLKEEPLGVPAFLNILAEELPDVAIGNYTKPFRRK
jgi:pyruvate-formate lyase-activating enzyme